MTAGDEREAEHAEHAEVDACVHDRDRLARALGYVFRDASLFEHALRHASFANEQPGLASNERLEFLGDAVIGLVAAELLFEAHPDWDEGALTRALHAIIDRRSLAELARRLGVGAALALGTTERQSRGHEKDSILSDGMEALLGALYRDGGLAPVRALLRREFAPALASGSPPVERDAKTRFQEEVMARFGEFPRYELERDSGVDGDELRFTVRAVVRGEPWSRGVGRSKRHAEFAAAATSLVRLLEETSNGSGDALDSAVIADREDEDGDD